MKNYQNVLEDKNHLTVVSRAHNTLESLENQAQDAFSVERTPPQYFMQRMGQLQIFSCGRGRYKLKNYQNQESLEFPADKKRFLTDFEQQESFFLLAQKKDKFMIQVPNFFRIYPKTKKLIAKPDKSDSIAYHMLKPDFEHRTEHNFLIERKKRAKNLIESQINAINLKAEGKFFYNKPTLKKKTNLEIEYLVIKAPFKPENATTVFLESHPQKTSLKDIKIESKFDIYYNMTKLKGFPLHEIYVSPDTNVVLHKKTKKTSFKNIEVAPSDKVELIKEPRPNPYAHLTIDDQPDLFIEEWPGKRYVSVGMEQMTFPGNLRNIYCLEMDPNEEIFVPNVYDMLLIQNFWDNLEIKSFRICLRPRGYIPNKNLINPPIENKENINENKDNNGAPEKEGVKDEDKKEGENNIDNKDGNDSLKKSESKGDEGKKKKFNLFKSVYAKK